MRATHYVPEGNGGSVLTDVDRFIDRFFQVPVGTNVWTAPVAIWSDNDRTYLELELAGLSSDDFEVVAHNGQLSITAERKAPEEERRYAYNDRRYGKFSRVFTLPDAIDPDSITAELTNGVLKLTLSHRPEAQMKKIKVQTR